MIQLYVAKGDEAIGFYKEAFDGKITSKHCDDHNNIVHAEMEAFGQIFAFSDIVYNEEELGNVSRRVQICLDFEKGHINVGRKIYESLKIGAIDVSKFCTKDTEDDDVYWEEWHFEVIDKYGISWCLWS